MITDPITPKQEKRRSKKTSSPETIPQPMSNQERLANFLALHNIRELKEIVLLDPQTVIDPLTCTILLKQLLPNTNTLEIGKFVLQNKASKTPIRIANCLQFISDQPGTDATFAIPDVAEWLAKKDQLPEDSATQLAQKQSLISHIKLATLKNKLLAKYLTPLNLDSLWIDTLEDIASCDIAQLESLCEYFEITVLSAASKTNGAVFGLVSQENKYQPTEIERVLLYHGCTDPIEFVKNHPWVLSSKIIDLLTKYREIHISFLLEHKDESIYQSNYFRKVAKLIDYCLELGLENTTIRNTVLSRPRIVLESSYTVRNLRYAQDHYGPICAQLLLTQANQTFLIRRKLETFANTLHKVATNSHTTEDDIQHFASISLQVRSLWNIHTTQTSTSV